MVDVSTSRAQRFFGVSARSWRSGTRRRPPPLTEPSTATTPAVPGCARHHPMGRVAWLQLHQVSWPLPLCLLGRWLPITAVAHNPGKSPGQSQRFHHRAMIPDNQCVLASNPQVSDSTVRFRPDALQGIMSAPPPPPPPPLALIIRGYAQARGILPWVQRRAYSLWSPATTHNCYVNQNAQNAGCTHWAAVNQLQAASNPSSVVNRPRSQADGTCALRSSMAQVRKQVRTGAFAGRMLAGSRRKRQCLALNALG